MDNFVVVQILVPADDLLCDHQHLCLWEFSARPQDIFEGSFIAKFLEQVDVVGRFLDIEELDYVRVF